MSSQHAFRPQWASHPGETIAEILRNKRIDLQAFASDLGGTEDDARCLLEGACAIDRTIAERLGEIVGGSVSFWLNREAQYREDIARLSEARNQDDATTWLKELPLRDMGKFGWISRFSEKAKQANECLRFFGVPSMAAWRASVVTLQSVVAFRSSNAYKSSPGAVSAWLRQGEILAAKISCQPWDADKLRASLGEIRKLTRVKDPGVFIPALQKIFATCGVAAVILQAPQGCRASGATKFISPNNALLLLSFRYRTDNHFWITVFHEIGHLLLHDHTALFIEGSEFITTQEEQEADQFSQDYLVPPELTEEMYTLPQNHRPIMRFAKRLGVSPGIGVGQL